MGLTIWGNVGFSMSLKPLKSLARAKLEKHSYEAYYADVNKPGNDRGAAILIAANIERLLVEVISLRFNIQTSDSRDEMFGQNGPAGDFSKKILLAHSLNIIGDTDKKALMAVREIRNAFAHTANVLNFATPEVVTYIDSIELPEPAPNSGYMLAGDADAFTKFRTITDALGHKLAHYGNLIVNLDKSDDNLFEYESVRLPSRMR